MALNKVIHPLVVDGGINTKTDEKLVNAGENLVVENVSYNKIGTIEKRNGSTKLTEIVEEVLIGSPLTTTNINPQFLIEHNQELLMGGSPGESGIYSYNKVDNQWNKKDGEPLSPFVFTEDIFSSEYTVISQGSVECPSFGIRYIGLVYSDLTNFTGIVIYKQDLETNSKKVIYRSDISSTSGGYIGVRVDAIDISNSGLTEPFLYVTYTNSVTAGAYYELNTLGFSNEAYIFTRKVTTNRTVVPYFDSGIIGSEVFIIWHESNVGNPHKVIGVGYVGLSGGLYAGNKNISTEYNDAIGALSFAYDSVNAKILICIGTTAGHPAAGNDNVVSLYVLDINLNIISTAVAYLQYGSNGEVFDVLKIISTTNKETPTLQNDVIFAVAVTYGYSFDNSANVSEYKTDRTISYNVFYDKTTKDVIAATAIYDPTFYGSITSKFWRIPGSDDVYFIAQSTIVPNFSYFIVRYSLSLYPQFPVLFPAFTNLGSFAIDAATFDRTVTAREITRSFELPQVTISADGNYYYPSLIQNRTLAISGSLSYNNLLPLSVLSLKRIEFNSEYNGINARLGGNTYIAGASVKEYDGEKLMEQGFYQFPEFYLSYTVNVLFPNEAGDYLYCAVFEYTDANGQIHRSAPSPSKKINLPNNNGHRTIKIASPFQYIQGAKKLSSEGFYSVVLYRTIAGGDIFYRVTPTTGLTNIFYSKYVSFDDDVLNADLEKAEPLYTNGGVLINQTISPLKYVITANNRIFGLSSEDDNLLYYSQEHISGEPVNFSNELSMRLDSGVLNRSGVSKTLGCLDSKIVIFKDQSIIYFSGNGPNQTGAQNDYSEPKIISSDVGIADIKSMVTIPDGIMFKSNKGIYLLDRSLNLSYIGFPVEAYNSEKINGCSNIVDEHKVLFSTSSRTLVYDYLSKKWSTWTWAVSFMSTYNKLPVYIKSKKVYQQDKTLYKDDTSFQSMKIVTPWIKLSGIQNYQRIYKVMILGKFKSAHTLTVKIYHDYDDTLIETHNISPNILDKIYQYDLSPTVQKGQSFKIEIYDNVSTGTGEGFSLSNLSLVLGQKKGANKTPDSQKY